MANKDKDKDKASSKDVATVETGGAVAGYNYGDDVGAGFEGTTSDDLSIPFLTILQSNSPQVENEDPAGAKSGMFFNTVTRELGNGDDGQIFLPVHKDFATVEWIPRNAGGGFVTMHDPNGDVVKAAIKRNDGSRMGKLKMSDDEKANELVDTHYVYGLLLDADGVSVTGFAVLSFNSTKIKPCRDWFTAMYTLKGKPPIFANRAVLRTVKQTNKHGSFYNFCIDPLKATWKDSLIDPDAEGTLIEEARKFRKMVTSGMAKAAFDTERSAGSDGEGNDGEEAPF